MAKMHLELRVNKKEVEALAEPRMLLIHLLREQLGITGPHIGCDTSHCGACTVDMNGKSVKSCTVFAVQAQGADIITVEGLVGGDGSLHFGHDRADQCRRDAALCQKRGRRRPRHHRR